MWYLFGFGLQNQLWFFLVHFFARCIVKYLCTLLSVNTIFHLHLCSMMLEMMYFRAELVQLTVIQSDSELEVQIWHDPIMLGDEL